MQKSLLSTIYISNFIGVDENNNLNYESPKPIFAQTSDVKSLVVREDVGYVPEYDRLVLVPYGEESQFIDEETRLWIDVEPNELFNNVDYKIDRVGDVIQDVFILYCNAVTQTTKPIYYLNEKTSTVYQMKLSYNNLVAIVPLNKWIPFNEDSKIWLTKPSSIDSNTNQIRLISKEKLEKSYKLTFAKVEV